MLLGVWAVKRNMVLGWDLWARNIVVYVVSFVLLRISGMGYVVSWASVAGNTEIESGYGCMELSTNAMTAGMGQWRKSDSAWEHPSILNRLVNSG